MEDLEQQIDRLAPLALLGEISALLAHEYNNLLTPLLNYAAAGIGSDDPNFQRKALERCLGAAKQAQRVSASILALSKQHGKIAQLFHTEQSSHAASVMASIEAALGAIGCDFAKDRIELEIDSKSDANAQITPAALEHIVLNLVLNSRRALIEEGGGLLTIKFRRRMTGGKPWVVIKVSDTGGGIKRDDLLSLLGPSARLRAEEGDVVECDFVHDRRGTRRTRQGGGKWEDVGTFSGGYGLIFCRRMAEGAGGLLWARSEVGKGTTIGVILPDAGDSVEALERAA